MKQITTTLLDVTNVTASGEGAVISTSETEKNSNLDKDIKTGVVTEG